MAGIARKAGKKNRKLGRNKASCEAYKREGRREKNAALRQAKHEKRFGAS